jgi:hypothetical protein
MGLVNHLENPKQWAIAHENSPKTQNDEFLVMPLKHILSVMGHVNPPEPKTVGNSSKKGHKHKNDEFLVMPVK